MKTQSVYDVGFIIKMLPLMIIECFPAKRIKKLKQKTQIRKDIPIENCISGSAPWFDN